MLKIIRTAALAASAALVLPALAGPGWPPTPPREPAGKAPAAVRVEKAPAAATVNGFEYVGGDAGWQLAQHKYEFTEGKLVMSDECDHAIRSARAPTPAEVESASKLSPGA